MGNKICHLSTVHPWSDTRIFFRECASLAEAGYEVHLIANADKDFVKDDITVHALVADRKSRLYRATVMAYRLYKKAKKIDADLYHFHDPELIWVGALLKWRKRKVIFDIHEFIRGQLESKDYIPFNNTFAKLFKYVDRFASKNFSIILAENSYLDFYKDDAENLEVVLNMPEVSKLEQFKVEDRTGKIGIFYLGVVLRERGLNETLEALNVLNKRGVDFHFHLVGRLPEGLGVELKEMVEGFGISEKVTFHGLLPIYEAFEVSKECKFGLSLLHPTKNYLESYSTKVFEYMSVSMPFVVSDFPLYDFVKEKELGLLVDPFDFEKIADAFEKLLEDTEGNTEMGKRGFVATKEAYNWSHQKAKLIKFYEKILSS